MVGVDAHKILENIELNYCIENNLLGYFGFSTRFSSKDEGSNRGTRLIKIGRRTAPPGSKNMAREGMLLKMSSNCF